MANISFYAEILMISVWILCLLLYNKTKNPVTKEIVKAGFAILFLLLGLKFVLGL